MSSENPPFFAYLLSDVKILQAKVSSDSHFLNDGQDVTIKFYLLSMHFPSLPTRKLSHLISICYASPPIYPPFGILPYLAHFYS